LLVIVWKEWYFVQGPAMALRNDVQSGAMNLKEKLSIELASDARRGKVTYGGHLFNAKVSNMLTIVIILFVLLCFIT